MLSCLILDQIFIHINRSLSINNIKKLSNNLFAELFNLQNPVTYLFYFNCPGFYQNTCSGKFLLWSPRLCIGKNNNNKDNKDKNSKKRLNAHLNDLCILLIGIWIPSSSLPCCKYLITFFICLCSSLFGNQIENLPLGVLTYNTELTDL